jgi:hypothetical protein
VDGTEVFQAVALMTYYLSCRSQLKSYLMLLPTSISIRAVGDAEYPGNHCEAILAATHHSLQMP